MHNHSDKALSSISSGPGFLLLPLPGFNLLPFAGFLEKLRFSADEEDYSRQSWCHWQIIGKTADVLQASSSALLQVTQSLDNVELADFDYLVVFGGRSTQACRELASEYQALFKRCKRAGLTLVSVDNACFTLAQAGIFQHGEVAVHWRHQQEFAAAFPDLRACSDHLYLLNGKQGSCMGGTATIELAAELLSRHQDRNLALKGLADMLVDEPRSQLHRLKSLPGNSLVNGSRHVQRAVALMRERLSGQSIAELADELGIGRRQLDRLFQAEYECSANQYWQKLRLEYVCWRLNTSTYALQQIAAEVGFDDVSNFNAWFRRHKLCTPTQFRQASDQLESSLSTAPGVQS